MNAFLLIALMVPASIPPSAAPCPCLALIPAPGAFLFLDSVVGRPVRSVLVEHPAFMDPLPAETAAPATFLLLLHMTVTFLRPLVVPEVPGASTSEQSLAMAHDGVPGAGVGDGVSLAIVDGGSVDGTGLVAGGTVDGAGLA